MTKQTMTYTEVIRRCHGLPYPNEQEYAKITSQFYRFRLREIWDGDHSGDYVTVGWILPSTVTNMPWTSKFKIDHHSKTIDIPYAPGKDFESRAIAEQLHLARAQGRLAMPPKLETEQYRVLGVADRTVRVPRGGSALFGIQTMGIQMTGYVQTGGGERKIWVPKRSATRLVHAGKMDNTVGGGATAEDADPLACMLREAKEEASLPEEYMREHAKMAGTISYFFVRHARAAGELGFLDRSMQFVYDVELPPHIVPIPSDGEVEEFHLWTVDQTVKALKEGQFKSNSAVTLIDFLIRHGYISARNEPELATLVSLINRRPCF